ncbi:putative MFS transporter [Daldinia caldariorum]|uniref:putative MFS transporter n=1 Tax=Daldinia caldariorum TaxID=326644 RepID=UPI0020083F8B|nr:putative MFS transporter [Daldinia caldariorum]KAI1470484.1 putative MFS transporter [Daldinia caldariorum]
MSAKSLVQHATADEDEDIDSVPPENDDGGEDEGLSRTGSDHASSPNDDPSSDVSHKSTSPNDEIYKVPATKRAAQVAFAIVACWFAAGIVYGFASLKPILIAEGVYEDLCPPDANDRHNNSNSSNNTRDGDADGTSDKVPCAEQDVRLNLFFIVASITTNVSSLAAGWILDRYGRRVCYVISGAVMIAGCVLMGLAFRITAFDAYLVANILLSLGGSFVFVPSFQLANAFPRCSGLIVALVTGAFDGSAAIFLFYRLAWEASGRTFTPPRFFFGYSVVGVLLLVGEFALMPPHAYRAAPAHESADLAGARASVIEQVRSARAERRLSKLELNEELTGGDGAEERRQKMASGIWGALHELPAHRQMTTTWFVLLLLLTIVQMLRMNYFIATIRNQYRYLLGSERLAKSVNHFFDIALPIGGVFATPFIGVLLNSLSVAAATAVLTLFTVVVGVLNCIPQLWAGYATVVAFVMFRPLYYSAISDFANKIFGFATFGRIYGTMTSMSGLVSFGQWGLDALVHGPLEGNPTPINAVMAAVGTILGAALTAYIVYHSRAFRRKLGQTQAAGLVQERLHLIREEREAEEATYGTMHY